MIDNKKFNITDYIPKGQENAVTARYLSSLLGLSQRRITLMIRDERLKGVPICATSAGDPSGYYLAESPSDKRLFYRQLSNRIREIVKLLKTFEVNLEG